MKLSLTLIAAFVLLAFGPIAPSAAQSTCGPDALQDSGSIYRICMPPAEDYNNRLVIWAHGFQDATEPVSIPEDQLCFDDVCLDDLFNGLGYGFATNSYSKTGLAILQGSDDILDLVDIFTEEQGAPERVYLVGASEGGIITTLLTEGSPEVIDGGVAACGPIGDFNLQLEYFGNARLVFEVLWPGLLPGGPFNEPQDIADNWPDYFFQAIEPALRANPGRLLEWVASAELPVDPNDFLTSAINSAEAVLRYAVVNYDDATQVLGGFPFGNTDKVFGGVRLAELINDRVQRVEADPAALAEIENYQTTGSLDRPLITIHTTADEQVPYFHAPIYVLKTVLNLDYLTQHFHIPYDRYGHCNFTSTEALVAFLLVLLYAGDLFEVQGVGEILPAEQLADFEAKAREYGIRYRLEGHPRVVSSKE
ncbi:MAG: alpha/beta hydrolase [Pseudomonadota bacterium]